MKLKRIALVALALILALALVGCSSKKDDKADGDRTAVKIGVVGETQEMWVPVIAALAEQGIDVELVSFSDYATPNRALSDGEIDLNAFQHHAYLEKNCQDNGYDLVSIGDTFISVMSVYSDKLNSIEEIGEGAKIAVPNDATNEGRALKILEAAGLITLNPDAGDTPEVSDITANPLNIELVEVDAANVYSVLPDVAAGVINCNYALDNGLNPGTDAIFQDSVGNYTTNSYFNLIAARAADAQNATYLKIVQAYQCDAVTEVFANEYKGAYIAAWK